MAVIPGKRGRAIADLPIAASDLTADAIGRPEPSDMLGPFERALFLEIVNARPADFFTRDAVPLLEQYCRHKCVADMLAIERANAADLKKMITLAYAEAKISSVMCSLAIKLGISRSSAKSAADARDEQAAETPWQ